MFELLDVLFWKKRNFMFEVLDVLFWVLKASPVTCTIFGCSLGIKKIAIKKKLHQFLVIKTLDPDPHWHWPNMMDPEPHWIQWGSTKTQVIFYLEMCLLSLFRRTWLNAWRSPPDSRPRSRSWSPTVALSKRINEPTPHPQQSSEDLWPSMPRVQGIHGLTYQSLEGSWPTLPEFRRVKTSVSVNHALEISWSPGQNSEKLWLLML